MRTTPSLIEAATQLWNVNITILQFVKSKDGGKIRAKKYYANRYQKKTFPTIYLTFDGHYYNYLITNRDNQPTALLALIDNPESDIDEFISLLGFFLPSLINNLFKYHPKDSKFPITATLLYFAARSGRTEIVQYLIRVENINLDGPQEEYSQNTPLHVATWRGHVNVIAILLFAGANPFVRNMSGEYPDTVNDQDPNYKKIKPTMDTLWAPFGNFQKIMTNEKPEALGALWKNHPAGLMAFRQQNSEFELYQEIMASVVVQTGGKVNSAIDNALLLEKISVDELCEILIAKIPPNENQMKILLSKISHKEINDLAPANQCTVLYMACRNGHYQVVQALLGVPGIKINGSQESYTQTENTPLHVANWYGHVRIVALLLLKDVKFETKKGSSTPDKEVNPHLSQPARNTLATLFQKSNDKSYLERIAREYTEGKENKKVQLPLWAITGVPKEDTPPQYWKADLLWYNSVGTKLTLLPLHENSHLNQLWQQVGNKPGVFDTNVPIPPETNFFGVGETYHFSYVPWKVDFMNKTAIINGKEHKLQVLGRDTLWFYSQVPINKSLPKDKAKQSASSFVPFPISICHKITNASKSMPAYKFSFSVDKSLFFGKTTNCVINFETSICRMYDGDTDTDHVVLTENDLTMKMYWEPTAFNQPTKQVDRFQLRDGKTDLDPSCTEWNLISEYFYLTMPKEKDGKPINKITKIVRYCKTDLIQNYVTKLPPARAVHDHNLDFRNSIQYERLLWHGTGTTSPDIIANGGWKINYAGDKNLWGRGTYFASDAAYSAGYAYQDKKTGHKQIFLAKVITGLGLQCLENKNIKDIPNGYNSIVGWRHGSWIYVVYDNALAVPWYLVEWSEINS